MTCESLKLPAFFYKINLRRKYNTNVLKNQQGENIKICNLYSGDLYFRIIWRSRGYVVTDAAHEDMFRKNVKYEQGLTV